MSSFLTKYKKPTQPKVEGSAHLKFEKTYEVPFELNVKSASNWLQNLPIDANRSWQIIISAMHALNEKRCDPLIRLNILETLSPVVFLLSKKLVNYASVANVPIAKKRKISSLSVKLHRELAVGYYLISTSDSFDSDFTDDVQPRIIYRAMRSYSLSLLRACQMHEAYSSTVWGRLNQLYGIAETRGFTDIDLDESEAQQDFHTSIDSLFKVIVLFTIINPYRFTQQEMSDIFELLEQTTDNVHLSSNKYEQGYLASVFVELHSNNPPALVGQSSHDEKNRYFFTWKFEHYLTHVDGKQTSWQKLSNYRPKLIPRFGDFSCLELSGKRKRQQMFQGFKGIFSFLRTYQPRFGVVPENKPQHKDWLKIPDFDLIPLENTSYICSSGQALQPVTNAKLQTLSEGQNGDGQDQSNFEFKGVNCFTVSTNLEGFFIIEIHITLEIGQIVAFSSPGEPVQIGSIRWRQNSGQEEQLQYVVERLATDVNPIIASFKSDSRVSVIFGDNNSKGVHGTSIFLPPAKYRCGTIFFEQNDPKKTKYQITKLREFNHMFCQYSIIEYVE